MIEYVVHGLVIIMVLFDLLSHWQHHKRQVKKRQSQTLYTLEEAFDIMTRGYNQTKEH